MNNNTARVNHCTAIENLTRAELHALLADTAVTHARLTALELHAYSMASDYAGSPFISLTEDQMHAISARLVETCGLDV